jgi:fumarate reductase flavoprotein subunit
VALELTTGKIQAITAKAVILCTGGCGRVFRYTTNAAIKTGDGMALAYRAGAPLKDMEFVQYHPTGLPFTGILITEAARAEGGYLLNKDGYRYLQDYNLGTPEPMPVLRSMELGPRDRLSQAFVQEQEKGRTVEGPYGPVVNLDLRRLGDARRRRPLWFRWSASCEASQEFLGSSPAQRYWLGAQCCDVISP